MRTLLNITYTRTPDGDLSADVHAPDVAQASRRPAVIYLHGGGWVKGDKTNPLYRDALVARGFVVISVNYRLAPTVTWPAPLHDCKAAVRWVRSEVNELGVDPERIGIWGHSAGGHLAAMMALTNGNPEYEGEMPPRGVSSAVRAAANWSGPTDLTQLHNPQWRVERQDDIVRAVESLLGGRVEDHPQAARDASPICHVRSGCVPLQTVQGDVDQVVTSMHLQPFHERMLAMGNPSEVHMIENAGHGLPYDRLTHLIADFFDRTLAA